VSTTPKPKLHWSERQLLPVNLTLAFYREMGYVGDNVERRLFPRNISVDYLGCIDVIVCHAVSGTIGIQATSAANHADRRKKACALPDLEIWLRAGNRFQIVSWRKVTAPGRRKKIWHPRVEELNLQDVIEQRMHLAPAIQKGDS
jgi:hypothetical protein